MIEARISGRGDGAVARTLVELRAETEALVAVFEADVDLALASSPVARLTEVLAPVHAGLSNAT